MRSEQKLVVERLANGGLAVKEVGPHSINHGHIVMQKSRVLHQTARMQSARLTPTCIHGAFGLK